MKIKTIKYGKIYGCTVFFRYNIHLVIESVSIQMIQFKKIGILKKIDFWNINMLFIEIFFGTILSMNL